MSPLRRYLFERDGHHYDAQIVTSSDEDGQPPGRRVWMVSMDRGPKGFAFNASPDDVPGNELETRLVIAARTGEPTERRAEPR